MTKIDPIQSGWRIIVCSVALVSIVVTFAGYASTQPSRIATLVHSNEGSFPDVKSVAFSPDGTLLASGSAQGTIKLWNVATQRNIRTLHEDRSVGSVVFSPDGTILASHSHDVNFWDVSTGQKIATLFSTYGSGAVAFSSDGTIFASGSPDNKVRLWDVATRREITTLVHGKIGPSLYAVAFSPGNTVLASGSGDGTIKLWSIANYEVVASLDTDSDAVLSVAFSPDGTLLASAEITQDPTDYSWESAVKLWDVKTKRDIATIEADTTAFGESYWYQSVAFSPSGELLATGSADNTVKLWDVETRRKVASLGHANYDGCIGKVHSVVFSPDGTIVASGAHVGNCGGAAGASRPWTGEVHLWDVSEWTAAIADKPRGLGGLQGKKLLFDTVFNEVDNHADKVNDGVNTIAPSMAMAGDTIKVEMFIEEGGGSEIIGGTAKFADSDMEMMFDDSWQVVAVDGIIPVLGADGIKDDGFVLGGLTAVKIPDSGYFATVMIMAKADISDGSSFYARHAIIGMASFEPDTLDVSEAIVTVTFTTSETASFSISMDGDGATGNQGVTTLNVATGTVVPIQLFGSDIRSVEGISVRIEYDAAQVSYVGFDPGDVLPNAQVLAVPGTDPTSIDISVVSFGGRATVDGGMVGSIRFRTTDAFSGTTLDLVQAEIGRGALRQSIAFTDAGVTLQLDQPTPDFNGDGRVDFGDFLAFGNRYGARRGDQRYEAKYDLDRDGTIGFGDFLIFGQEFGRTEGV